MVEAPEGIVAYSWSGTIPNNANGVPIFTTTSLQAAINNGTVVQAGTNAYVDLTDFLGKGYKNTEKLVLSQSLIQVLDLISEGEIDGPLTGLWIYSGATAGQTGWSSAYFSGYQVGFSFNPSQGWLRSVYWNEIPVLSDAGQLNFQNTNVSWYPGTQNGNVFNNYLYQESSSRAIGDRLYGTLSKYYRILNKDCLGVIVNVRMPQVSKTNPDNGNIGRSQIQWQISYRPIFYNSDVQTDFNQPYNETVFGKILAAGGYVRSTQVYFDVNTYFSKSYVQQATSTGIHKAVVGRLVQVDNPVTYPGFNNRPDFQGWEVQVYRVTPDSTTSLIQNPTYIESITELYGSSLTYPCSAVVASSFSGQFFSSVPSRAYECNLIKVNVPANYNPILRTYSTTGPGTTNGYWDGTFASETKWTNNPAWVYYDMLTNTRYGLGKYINNVTIDKFSLYKIAQYCDTLVPDSLGYLEPRFTCNTVFTQRADAFKVINDLASVFNAISYYAYGTIYTVQDSPKYPRVLFTNANVENGNFNYSTSSKKTRQSVAIVRYNNPKNFYRTSIEYIENLPAIRRFGIREIDLTSFASTSRGQAIRLGNWALLSNNTEVETVQFVGGLEATSLRAGDVFSVCDFNRKGKRYAGRVRNISNYLNSSGIGTGAQVILDSVLDLQTGIDYTLSVMTPSYYYDSAQVTGLTDQNFNDIRRSFIQNFDFWGDNTFVSSGYSVINLNTGFDQNNYIISGYPIFVIELGTGSSSYSGSQYFFNTSYDNYRVINIKESDTNKYEIVGLQYNGDKFSQIDSGIVNQYIPGLNNDKTPGDPSNLVLGLYNISDPSQIVTYAFMMNSYSYVTNYNVYVTTGQFGPGVPSSDFLYTTLPSDVNQGTFFATQSATYNFLIYAYNANNKLFSRNPVSGSITITLDLPIETVIISSLQMD